MSANQEGQIKWHIVRAEFGSELSKSFANLRHVMGQNNSVNDTNLIEQTIQTEPNDNLKLVAPGSRVQAHYDELTSQPSNLTRAS